jgi:hypothetical protein
LREHKYNVQSEILSVENMKWKSIK